MAQNKKVCVFATLKLVNNNVCLSKHEECNSLIITAWSELNPGKQTGTRKCRRYSPNRLSVMLPLFGARAISKRMKLTSGTSQRQHQRLKNPTHPPAESVL
jgi:hypothetical protein